MKWETEYQRMLAEARILYETDLLPELVESLYISFADAIERIVADFGAGEITAARAAQLEASIIERIGQLGDNLTADAEVAISDAAKLASEGHRFALEAASRAAGVSVSQSFASIPNRALDRMLQRRGFASIFRTLINRHILDMADDVEVYLRSAVTRGISGVRGGRELAMIMARDDPELLGILENLGPRGRRTARAIREGIEFSPEEMKRARSILFDGRRIMITETNHAYHEGDALAAQESPVVDLVRWTLSGRHAGLPSSPDVCDVAADADYHGYGPGIYHKGAVPPLLHPFCACSTDKILRPPSEWDAPPREMPEPGQKTLQEAESILRDAAKRSRVPGGPRTITPRHVERQLGIINASVQRVHQVATAEVVQ